MKLGNHSPEKPDIEYNEISMCHVTVVVPLKTIKKI